MRLSSVPPGSWELLVQASGSAVTGVQVQAPGASVPVTLPPATSLRVVVPAAMARRWVRPLEVAAQGEPPVSGDGTLSNLRGSVSEPDTVA